MRTPSASQAEAMSIDCLDLDCLSIILSFLPPVEICAAATVGSAWRDASLRDIAWTRVAPTGRTVHPVAHTIPSALEQSSQAALANAGNARERAVTLVTRGWHVDDRLHLRVDPRNKAVQLSIHASK